MALVGALFGGNKGGRPPKPEQDAKKGATDLEKLSRKRAYGASKQSFNTDDNLLSGGGDTTLSSGSLLSLGGALGNG